LIAVSGSSPQQLTLVLGGVDICQEVYISSLLDRSRLKLLFCHPRLVMTVALVEAVIFCGMALGRDFFLLNGLAGRR
jgi:hypothetical protein